MEVQVRLDKLEEELHQKSRHIAQAQEEIELTNEIHTLWLKATQENTPEAKISIYDQILQLRADDVEALTYKADAAVELGQVQWAHALSQIPRLLAFCAKPQDGGRIAR